MSETTLIRRRGEMNHRPLPHCHDGRGELDWTGVLEGDVLKGRTLRFVHDFVMPPGASVGEHTHDRGEEYYYILSGRGEMILDGRRSEVQAGDITGVFAGGSHGLENNSEADLRVVVICVA